MLNDERAAKKAEASLENNTYGLSKRSLSESFWSFLGFRHPKYLDMDDLDIPGWAPGYFETTTLCVFDWRDRLRVLVSGRVIVQCKSKTDVAVERGITRSTVSVLPPREGL